MAVSKFQARHLTGAYIVTAIAYDAGTALEDETMTANIAELKNLEVTPPESTVEQVRTAGNYAQTIGTNQRTAGSATGVTPGYFQNTMMHQVSATNWKISGTAVFTGDEQFSHILGFGTTQAISGSPAGTRYAVGDFASTGANAQNLIGGIRADYDNGSEGATAMLTNVFITKRGTIKPTGADGYFEMDFEAECLPKDGAIEFAT